MSELNNRPSALNQPQPACRDQPQDKRGHLETNCYQFEQLSAGNNQVSIEFQGKQYVLRRTRTGGLILNKQ